MINNVVVKFRNIKNSIRKNTYLYKILIVLISVLMLTNFTLKSGFSEVSAITSQTMISPKDDFYTYVNKDWLETAKIIPGFAINSVFLEVAEQNEEKFSSILKKLLSKSSAHGTSEQRLVDFYKSIIDIKNRNAQGIAPIKRYIDAYDNATNLNELLTADLLVYEETGSAFLFSFETEINIKNRNEKILQIENLTNYLPKYIFDDEMSIKAYEKFLSTILSLSETDTEMAASNAKIIIDLEKILAKESLESNELYDMGKTNNIYKIDDINKFFPNVDMALFLKRFGYGNLANIKIKEIKKFEKSAEYFTEQSLESLKLYAKTRMLISYGKYLSQNFSDVINIFHNEIFGIETQPTLERKAIKIVANYLHDDLGILYIKNYFKEESKKCVEDMISKIIKQYKKMIHNSSWLSKPAKDKAIKKLEKMDIKVGYPNNWSNQLDDIEIRNFENGGSFFLNICEIQKRKENIAKKSINEIVNKGKWTWPVYNVNAGYDPQNNEIIFPAGILQEPFYDINASEEQNMGAIGTLIGHEISHAFDSIGSQFDENGNATVWWSTEDILAFEKRCKEFEIAYDDIKISEGVFSNGQLTLFENIADIGGMSCILNILSKKDNPNYKAFFESFARMWRLIITPTYLKNLSMVDVHSANNIRVNRTIANFEEFYKTYNVRERDKMYVSPAKRVSLW